MNITNNHKKLSGLCQYLSFLLMSLQISCVLADLSWTYLASLNSRYGLGSGCSTYFHSCTHVEGAMIIWNMLFSWHRMETSEARKKPFKHT